MKRLLFFGAILSLLIPLFIPPVFGQGDWRWQYPIPQGNPLYDVEFLDSARAMAVGSWGTAILTTDGGTTWSVRSNVAGLTSSLRAVSYIDSQTAVAVGSGGIILKTSDGGLTWAAHPSGTSSYLYGMTFVDANIGTAVGGSGVILRTSDGGNTWTPQTSGTTAPLWGVDFVDGNNGVAVGYGGIIIRTTDGGTNWTPQASPTTKSLHAIHFGDDSTGFAVGSDLTVVKTIDGGATWVSLSTPPWDEDPVLLHDVHFTDAAHGVSVGEFDSYGEPVCYILRTTDGGSSWDWDTEYIELYGVGFGDASTGLAVGNMGTIRRTTNGGASWTLVGGPSSAAWMKGVDCWDVDNGVAVASSPCWSPSGSTVFLRTSDGGTTWTWNMEIFFQMQDIAYADATTVYAVGMGPRHLDVGATILRSINGGLDWDLYWGTSCAPDGTGCDTYFEVLNAVSFADLSAGVAVGSQGSIVTIRNGVVDFATSNTTKDLYGVSMPDSMNAFAVGDGGTILISTDGGATWSQQASGTLGNLRDVCFVDSLTGTAVGYSGFVLRTTDGGNIWSPQATGVTENFTAVSFVDSLNGFIVGPNIILSTTDGGATWMQEMSPSIKLIDVHAVDVFHATAVGGNWNIIARRDESVAVFFSTFTADVSEDRVELKWSVAADEAFSGYRIYRKKSGSHNEILLNDELIAPDVTAYIDRTVEPSSRYDYTLAAVHSDGSETRSIPVTVIIPGGRLELFQNYPNPFNPSTNIRFSLPHTQHVVLSIYDVSGRRVVTLIDGVRTHGLSEVVWDGRDTSGNPVGSGIYFYRLKAGKTAVARKMVLIK